MLNLYLFYLTQPANRSGRHSRPRRSTRVRHPVLGAHAQANSSTQSPRYSGGHSRAVQVYSGVGESHTLDTVGADGEILKLDDGSIWQVSSVDQVDTSLWLATEDILVIDSKNPSYPYLRINTDSR